VIEGVHFDFGKANLRPLSKSVLNTITSVLAANPGLKLQIGGHTDNIGSAAYNKRLSKRRAKAVMDYLIQHGIDASRLSAHGYGFDVPVASNKTAEGRAKNRRVELNPL
jgi:OOP family OmpA-OmpF porin